MVNYAYANKEQEKIRMSALDIFSHAELLTCEDEANQTRIDKYEALAIKIDGLKRMVEYLVVFDKNQTNGNATDELKGEKNE